MIRIFEEKSGRKFEVERVPEEALRGMRAAAKTPVEETFAALMQFVGGGDEIDMGPVLAQYPMRLTTVREYADRVLAG